MGPDRIHLVVTAAIMAFGPIVVCPVIIVVCARAANGRLERNGSVGIRTPSTMRSDRAWIAGHRAALRLAPLYVLVAVAVCVALLWAVLYSSAPGALMLTGIGGNAVLFASIIFGAIMAGRAAKAVDGPPEGRRRQ